MMRAPHSPVDMTPEQRLEAAAIIIRDAIEKIDMERAMRELAERAA